MNVKKLTAYSLIIALTVVLSLFVHIPVPGTQEFFTLTEVGVFSGAILFGGPAGLVIGGGSGLLIDLLSGSANWAIFSLIIHGIEGFLVGTLCYKRSKVMQTIGILLGSLVMIVAYALVTGLYFGYGVQIVSVVGNVLQCIAGFIVAIPVIRVISKQSIVKDIRSEKKEV
jgi:uncharacterized membrane protein